MILNDNLCNQCPSNRKSFCILGTRKTIFRGMDLFPPPHHLRSERELNILKHMHHTEGSMNSRRVNYFVFFPAVFLLLVQIGAGSVDLSSNRAYEPTPADNLNAECIIITPSGLYFEAKQLSNFHENSLGVLTSVVNITWIDANYNEAADPPFLGYWDDSLRDWNQIVGYNYSLAKKIVSFLRDEVAHPNLEYVLLYGNAELVPPSFYWFDLDYAGCCPYDAWVPTDVFYGSPDHDLTPNYAVGRLPVDDNVRAQELNQKMENWYSNLSADWFENAAVAGGRASFSAFYLGELTNQIAINRGYFDGFRITKYYLTDERFNRTHMLEALSGEYGVFYEVGRGWGDSIVAFDHYFHGEKINVTDVMNLPRSSNVSVFVSTASGNGAFDTTVMANKPFTSEISFGESLLFSPGGAIGYVGSARLSTGNPVGILDEGELRITGETYMAHILTDFWRAFREGAETLGNVSMKAMADFVASQNMDDMQNKRTLFEYVLLGNPVLPMTHPREDRYEVPTTQIMNATGSQQSFGSAVLIQGQIPVVSLGVPNSVKDLA